MQRNSRLFFRPLEKLMSSKQRSSKGMTNWFVLGFLCLCLGADALFPARAVAAFGLTNSGGYYTVDSGAGLVFKVSQANGSMTSLVFNGTELQDQTKFSHIASGFGGIYSGAPVTVTATTYSTNYIKVTVNVTNGAKTLTHYYMARNGFNNIYMATYMTAEPDVGELRFIARLQQSKVPNCPAPSNIRGNTGAIESSDVFGLANGQTRSKYYGRDRAIDLSYRGVTGNGVGVFMIYDNRESSSGGPFYRDIMNQTGDQQELYNYMNSGHEQTEAYRTSVLYGPYVYAFTNGAAPDTALDTSWIKNLGLTGWVQNRGYVVGKASGIAAGFEGVVGFANATAQYWCKIDPATGNFTSPWIKPGDYAMTLYKGELAVASDTVTVPQSTVPVTKNIASTEIIANQRWRIGEWDGTPAGFLNADKILDMHPSDVRMSAWGPLTYTIGQSSASSFPMAQWKDVNNPTTIKFDLTAEQIVAHTLRIGLTVAFAGARPQVSVNAWTSSVPTASSQPNSRSLTLGTYRGNNVTYTYNIPASAFVVGTNTMYLSVVSGSSGTTFLSPGYGYDAIELDAPFNGTYRITPQHAQDKAMEVFGNDPNNGAPIDIYSYHGGANQQFLLDLQADGTYRIRTAQIGNRILLSVATNATIGKARGVGTITNDDSSG